MRKKFGFIALFSLVSMFPLLSMADPCDAFNSPSWKGTVQAKFSTGQLCTWSAATATGGYAGGEAMLNVTVAGGSSPQPGVTCQNGSAMYTGTCNNGALKLTGPNGSQLAGLVMGNNIGLNGQDANFDQWSMSFSD